jgi:hypothetical protein
MKKLMICLLGLPLALSGCVSDEEMAAESPGARLMDEVQQRQSMEGFSCGLAGAAAAFAHPENREGIVASNC